VDELGADCGLPAASVKANDREIVRPRRVTSGQLTRPVLLDRVQLDRKSLIPKGPRSHPRSGPIPPKNSGRMPPPISPPSSCALRSGLQGIPASPPAAKLLSVELKPAGVERKAAVRSEDVPAGDVVSEHAAAATIAPRASVRLI